LYERKRKMEISDEMNKLTYKIIGICMEVHKVVGPGFPEEYYQNALEYEFPIQEVAAVAQKPLAMMYKLRQIGSCFLDFEIEEKLILEIKSVNRLTDVHMFQVLKYLSVGNYEIALLINFGNAKLDYHRILPTSKWQEFKKIHSR